jgi:hypothetical protein
MAAKINETYLLWVLAVRAEKRALTVKSPFKWHDIGHTGASWAWTNKQSERIDEIGLDAWLQTKGARAPKDTTPWLEEDREKKKCECPPNKCLRQLK